MRIISKYQDYYDSCQRYGMDAKLVWSRNSEFLEKEELPSDLKGLLSSVTPQSLSLGKNKLNVEIKLNYYILFFCGKAYPFFEITHGAYTVPDDSVLGFSHISGGSKFFYCEESAIKFLQEKHNISRKSLFRKSNKYFERGPVFENLQGWKDAVYQSGLVDKVMTQVGVPRKSPCLLYPATKENPDAPYATRFVYGCLELNPCLKDISFYKVMVEHIAYQELSMYVGGVLPRDEAMTAIISDKDRIIQHGFDKYSFKKAPSKK